MSAVPANLEVVAFLVRPGTVIGDRPDGYIVKARGAGHRREFARAALEMAVREWCVVHLRFNNEVMEFDPGLLTFEDRLL